MTPLVDWRDLINNNFIGWRLWMIDLHSREVPRGNISGNLPPTLALSPIWHAFGTQGEGTISFFFQHQNYLGACLVAPLYCCMCPTLCNLVDWVALQAPLSMRFSRPSIQKWVAIPFSRGFSPTLVSCIGRWILYHGATRETLCLLYLLLKPR